jgi:hypothetical protein
VRGPAIWQVASLAYSVKPVRRSGLELIDLVGKDTSIDGKAGARDPARGG